MGSLHLAGLPDLLFIQPVLDHAGWKEWTLTGLATVIFLSLYFGLFWLERPKALLHIAGMVILGLVFAPINSGSLHLLHVCGGIHAFL